MNGKISFFRAALVAVPIALMGGWIAPAVFAQDAPTQAMPEFAPAYAKAVSEKPLTLADMPKVRRFVTHHKAVVRGQPLAYTATAGETYITNIAQEPVASIFSFSYVVDGGNRARPVMFIFNGGPGSSSIWLHMGAVGPKRLVLDREVNPANTPPFGVRDNPFSILDVADLVFVDPVGTGFSRAVGHARNTDFYSVDADADSMARFIEAWLSEHGRWNSPKYLMGESYGSIRASVLPRALMGGPLYTGVMRGITVNGVVLLGTALNVGRPRIPAPSDTPDRKVGLTLPSLAVTAWYHHKSGSKSPDAASVYNEAKAFALGDYADAMFRLGRGELSDVAQRNIAQKLAYFTGISADKWLSGHLKIDDEAFRKELLASSGMEIGTYDSRYILPKDNDGGDPVADDPAMGQYVPGFVAAFHGMLRDDLSVDLGIPYNAITWEGLNGLWSYKRIGLPIGVNYGSELAVAMRRTPALRVMVASGYYDLQTTPASAEAQVKASGMPADRVELRDYESGHMLYLGDTAEKFANDVRAFILAGQKPSAPSR